MIEIRPAGPEDNEQLLALLGRCPRGKTLVVRQERHGDFFRRSDHFEYAKTYAAWDGDRIVGALECALNPCQMNGNGYTGGYLHGLSVDPEYRRLGIAGRLLVACEDYILKKGADFAYCTVMKENFPSLGLLSRNGYTERAQLQMMTLVSLKRKPLAPGVRVMTEDDYPEVASLLNRTYRSHDLYQSFTGESLAAHLKRLPDCGLEDIFVNEQHGEITACLGCWPVSTVVSSVIVQWDRRLEIMTRMAGYLRRWFPLPHIPQIGEAYRHCTAYPMGYKHSVRDLGPLWNAVHARVQEKGLGSLTVSCEKNSGSNLLREAGYALRGGDSRLLMKVFKNLPVRKDAQVFLSPLE